jgi:copper chaperone CopZ
MPLYAEVIPAKDYNIGAVVEEINSKGILSDLAVSRKAVVKIPLVISMKSVQADLNLSKDVNFEEPFAGAIVSIDSMVGDELKVTLSLAMKGNVISRETMQAYMSDNLSIYPVRRLAETSAKIARLDDFLGFDNTIKYNGFDLNALKASLEGIDGIQKAEISLEQIGGSFGLDINAAGTDINTMKLDVNSAFTALAGITKVALTESEGKLNANITYDPETGYAAIRPLALAEAEKILAGKNYAFVDPNADLNCVLFFSGLVPSEIALNAKAAMAVQGVDLNFWRQAFFDANSLADFQTGEEFVFPEGISELPVRVKPSSEIGRDLNLQILFQTTRKTIDVAYAAEAGQ